MKWHHVDEDEARSTVEGFDVFVRLATDYRGDPRWVWEVWRPGDAGRCISADSDESHADATSSVEQVIELELYPREVN